MSDPLAPYLPARVVRILSAALLTCALCVLALGSPIVSSAHADQPDDVTWTVRTESNSFGAERTSFAYTLDPGSSVTDGLVIANHGDTDVTVKIYAADGHTSQDGQLSLLVGGTPSDAIGVWIAPGSSELTVAAGATATVPFTVAIPDNATPGDYAGGLITSLTVPDATTGVNVDRRLGIRVDLRVGGDLTPSLAVENMSVGWNGGLNPFAGGDVTVTYTLHNTGNAMLSSADSVGLAGVFGWFPVQAQGSPESSRLLPGESRTQTVVIPDVPALVLLFANAAVTPLVVDASGSTMPLDEVTGSAVGWAVPWMLLMILLLLAAAIVLLLRERQRRRAVQREREQARLAEAVEHALERERAAAAARIGDD